MKKDFDESDLGCHADASFGHDHVRKVLSILVRPYDEGLSDELLLPMSGDASEEGGNNHMSSAVFGAGAQLKARAYETILDMVSIPSELR